MSSTLEMTDAARSRLAENLSAVHGDIADACARAGRNADSVKLVAVTKYAERPWVAALLDLGVTHVGESRPQQLVARVPEFAGRGVHWHMIGHLQRNKVRPVLPLVTLIHSVDSPRLLDRINRLAGELGLRARVLLEVNVSGEASKDGFAPEALWDLAPQLEQFGQVEIGGLMTMAPRVENPEQARICFRTLRQLRDELRRQCPGLPLETLSMGMSGDFPVAIEEGATLVRVGSRLFEGLESTRSQDEGQP